VGRPIELEPLFPDRESSEPLGRQFVRRLRAAIQCGHFPPASRLLPTRELAVRLGLSRNTVIAAIEQLIAEGFLESRIGSGTYVASTIVAPASNLVAHAHSLPANAERFTFARSMFVDATIGIGPLRAGVPDLSTFPHAIWARLARGKLAELPQYLSYGETNGEPALRDAIARHVRQFRGVSVDPQRVIVVEGTQGALRLATDVLLAENDAALIEDPAYPFLYGALRARSIRLVPLPIDEDGMDVGRAEPARVAFVAPSHQFPFGARMNMERRHTLLAWASENDAYVVEDDYDSEFVFDGKPLPALQSIDDRERVVYVGTFSKTLAPGLRLGYVIVPPHLVDAFAAARFLATLGSPRYVQATLAQFVSEGHFARHIRRMTQNYRERRATLVEFLQAGLRGTGLRLGRVRAGLSLVIIAPSDFDDIAVRNDLIERGVWVQALSAFCIERTDCRGFIVAYSAEPMPQILAAAEELLRAIHALTLRPSSPELR
jgi:GntR family transcriptional regulator/MocR family aminotransferase